MKNYQYILFDLDGTLTNSQLGITTCVAYALESFGIHTENPEELRKFIGPPLKESFVKYYNMTDGEGDRAVEKYRERFATVGLYENEVYAGIPELLQKLKAQGKTLLVATSKPTVYSDKILEHFGLKEYFSYIAGSELDGTRVNKAEVIQYALEQMKITESEKIVMIGDKEHDMIGAGICGVDSIGVLYGFGEREELENHGATYIAETVSDLEKILL
ncbi:HAD hydrolase, family IA [Lachnospiraceae bacterium 2_1_46FAA]|nr:HAD hydrolase, family IA [Lachnospiraceae bacterium 2_1_46FAA]